MPLAAAARKASSRLYAYLDPETALTTLLDGQIIYVDPADEGIAPSLIAYGYWEPWIEPVIRRLVGPGDRVLEVGANFGFYTIIMASQVGPGGHIDAFEANPSVARLLRRTVVSNGCDGFVKLHEKIVADRNGVMTFATSRRWGGAGGILENGRDFGDETCLSEVEAVRLDDAFAGQTFDFIRTDAEGSEVLILNGAMDILERSRSIKLCVEWSPGMMRGRGDVAALAHRLEAMQFKFWRIVNPTGLDPSPLTAAQAIELGHGDMLIARDLDIRRVMRPPRPSWKRPLHRVAWTLGFPSR
ncbi:MAG TPA: FkbM family methyltransferase [Caulobacteraceae bacterium]|nr:FkbM family methyltransferase [Caulobacteraceae bacterium]